MRRTLAIAAFFAWLMLCVSAVRVVTEARAVRAKVRQWLRPTLN